MSTLTPRLVVRVEVDILALDDDQADRVLKAITRETQVYPDLPIVNVREVFREYDR